VEREGDTLPSRKLIVKASALYYAPPHFLVTVL
jgi:hypothetical protein